MAECPVIPNVHQMPTCWTREYKPRNFRRHYRPIDLTPPSDNTLNPIRSEECTTLQDQPKAVIARRTYKDAEKPPYKYPPFVGKNRWVNGKLSDLDTGTKVPEKTRPTFFPYAQWIFVGWFFSIFVCPPGYYSFWLILQCGALFTPDGV